jgi:formate dehydrogenase major subunit
MALTRRTFLAAAAGSAGAGGLVKTLFGVDLSATRAYARARSPIRGKLTTTICPFCSVGCGMLVAAANGRVVSLTGDPDHPVNEGATCSKGAGLRQVWNSARRVTKVLYRAPGASEWEERDWAWALPRIARRVKDTRDSTFETRDREGRVVNRTQAMGSLGGAAMDNEECYALTKFARAMGMVFLEHHARL